MLAQLGPRPAQRRGDPGRAPRRSRSGCSSTRRSSTTAISLWKALRRALLEARSATRTAPCAQRLLSRAGGVRASGCATTTRCASASTGCAADVAVFAVERYGAELTTVITHTIERWDGKEAARRIELHVGRDLQFIRINGTIVGGLVGVLIHAFSVLVN